MGQGEQLPEIPPRAVLYAPAPHDQHWWWKSRPYPVKYLPAAQSWQVPDEDAPTTAEYEPGPH